MRTPLVTITALLCLSGCEPRASTEQSFREALAILHSEPAWLDSGGACPAEVMRKRQVTGDYSSERCSEHPKLCLQRCERGNANACYGLALVLQDHPDASFAQTEALFFAGCANGNTSACTNAAAGLLATAGNDEAVRRCAADTFEKTCSQQDPWGCTMLLYGMKQQPGAAPGSAQLRAAIELSCLHGLDDPACQAAQSLNEALDAGNP